MNPAVSHDAYLSQRPPEQQAALGALRALIARLVPGAEEVMSYAMPGFRVGKNVVAGYAGHAKTCGFYPHSDSIVPHFAAELDALGFHHTKGAVQFTPARPLPDALVVHMVAARLDEAAAQ